MKWIDRILEPFRTLGRTLKAEKKRATPELQAERLSVCEDCPEYHLGSQICRECICVMPIKVTFQEARCPFKKWKE